MLLLEHPHTVYIINTTFFYITFIFETAISSLHPKHHFTFIPLQKYKTTQRNFIYVFFLIFCCCSHKCGIIAFYIYVELLYAYIVQIYIIHFMTANVYVDTNNLNIKNKESECVCVSE